MILWKEDTDLHQHYPPKNYENPEDNFWNILEDNDHEFDPKDFSSFSTELEDLSGPVENLSEENSYSKTHIRKQKIKPSNDDTENEYQPENLPPVLPVENLSDPVENMSEENAYSKTHIRKQKTRPRNPQLTTRKGKGD
eukprot:TRINITY_DN24673_c0_g1_i1.p1 TRINITY_DN24673_c0_g1~~TRINITY_DN24673_c0_g1_i1.p1  ORF type:complete len:139 (-),score=28.70 TRINITY_DN24673_c0_g1_i1:25-441(-)